jgi:tol-pal system protein YbgF
MRRLLLGIPLLAACSTAVSDAALRDLRARFEASEQARIEVSRKVEELDNRVFLLTDQVESQKVLAGQKGGEPRLPVITLQPSTAPRPGDTVLGGGAAAESSEQEPTELDPPTVIGGGARTTIKMDGDGTPWLDHGEGGAARIAPANAGAVAGRRGRSVAPAVERGLGVTRGKPPLVDEVVGGGSAPVASPAATGIADDPTALYRAAYGKLKAGQNAQAADDLRAFVRRFPRHDLADNAQYWLAESFYERKAYDDAELEFRTVIRRWPSGNKAPDALLKLAYCLLVRGDVTLGRTTLQQVVEHYPRTDAAALAMKRLSELPTESKP